MITFKTLVALLLILLHFSFLKTGNIISSHKKLPKYWTIKFKKYTDEYVARIPYKDSIEKLKSFCSLSKINNDNSYSVETCIEVNYNFNGSESITLELKNSGDLLNFNLQHEDKSITWNDVPINSFSATLSVAVIVRKD